MGKPFTTTAAMLGLGVLLTLGTTFAAQQKGARLSAADRQFVTKAAQGGMAEVELGNLAVKKASSQSVKDFGQRMVDDHTKANDQLKQVAANEGITLPTSLDSKDKKTMAHLSKLSGTAFDKAYMSDMVKDHKKDVADFQREAKTGQDSEVKGFAAKTLPTLQEHLQMAMNITSGKNQSPAFHRANGMTH